MSGKGEKSKITPEGIEGKASRRNLHFFWIIDCSGSMDGTKIQKVNYAIKSILPEIEKIGDSNRINISMYSIQFGSNAKWHIGPTGVTIEEFQRKWKDLEANCGLTNTPAAIQLLTEALDIEKMGRRNVPPVCILLSDGYCTESGYEDAINKLNSLPWGKKAVRLSIGIEMEGTSYNKDELDMFISPYLYKEGIETLHADTSEKLTRHIRIVSTQATTSASQSRAVNAEDTVPPVQINKDALENTDDFSDIDADNVF